MSLEPDLPCDIARPFKFVLFTVATSVLLLSHAVSAAAVTSLVEPSAASYTHLRAHYTVIDLVCRLLLEKKNVTIKREHSIFNK